jgi:hypothetical protein
MLPEGALEHTIFLEKPPKMERIVVGTVSALCKF